MNSFEPLNGTDQNPIDPAKWQAVPGRSILQVSGNQCIGTALEADNAALYLAAATPDQSAEIRIAALAPDGNSSCAMFLRAASDLSTGYILGLVSPAIGLATVLLVGPGGPLLQIQAQPFRIGDAFRARIKGTELAIFQNGSLIGRVVDCSVPSGGLGLGIYPYGAIGNAAVIDFVAEDL